MNRPDPRMEEIDNMKFLASSGGFFYIGNNNTDDDIGQKNN